MPEHPPPETYDDLLRLIRDRFEKSSKSHQTIASFITQNPKDVAVVAVSTLAEKCGVHSSGIVRYAQTLGYKGFKEMQAVFLRHLSTAVPSFEARVAARERRLGEVPGKAAQVVFCLPEHETCASHRLAAAMCLAQGLCRAMASIGR